MNEWEREWARKTERLRELENKNEKEWVNEKMAVSESENKSERGPLAGPPKIHRNSAAIQVTHQLAPFFVFYFALHFLLCPSSFRHHINRPPLPPSGECDERQAPPNHPQISSRSPPGSVKPNIYKATWISLLAVLPPLTSLFRIIH